MEGERRGREGGRTGPYTGGQVQFFVTPIQSRNSSHPFNLQGITSRRVLAADLVATALKLREVPALASNWSVEGDSTAFVLSLHFPTKGGGGQMTASFLKLL